jgi:hypothetical protein
VTTNQGAHPALCPTAPGSVRAVHYTTPHLHRTMLRQHYAARCRSSSSVTLQQTLHLLNMFDSIAVTTVTQCAHDRSTPLPLIVRKQKRKRLRCSSDVSHGVTTRGRGVTVKGGREGGGFFLVERASALTAHVFTAAHGIPCRTRAPAHPDRWWWEAGGIRHRSGDSTRLPAQCCGFNRGLSCLLASCSQESQPVGHSSLLPLMNCCSVKDLCCSPAPVAPTTLDLTQAKAQAIAMQQWRVTC